MPSFPTDPGYGDTMRLFKLVDELAARGFQADLSDYVDICTIVERNELHRFINKNSPDYTPHSQEEIEAVCRKVRNEIAAVICRNEIQQRVFYEAFDAFIEEHFPNLGEINDAILTALSNPKKLVRETARELKASENSDNSSFWKKNTKYFVIFIPFILFLIFVLRPKPQENPAVYFDIEWNSPENKYTIGDSIVGKFHANALNDNDQQRLNELHPIWQLEWRLDQQIISRDSVASFGVVTKSGELNIGLHITETKLNIDTTLYATLETCSKPPQFDIVPDNYVPGSEITITAKKDDSTKNLFWLVNDSISIENQETIHIQTENKPEVIHVLCYYEGEECSSNSLEIQPLIVPEPFLSITNTAKAEQVVRYYSWKYILVVLILAFLSMILIVRHENKTPKSYNDSKKINEQIASVIQQSPLFKPKKLNPPQNLQYPNLERLIKPQSIVAELNQMTLERSVSDVFRLNIPDTIRSTIKNADLISPVISPIKGIRDYILLLDITDGRSLSVLLFDHIIKQLSNQYVNITIYHFEGKPTSLIHPSTKQKVSIEEAYIGKLGAALVVLSVGNYLIDPKNHEVNREIHDSFSFWENRVLITPLTFPDWSVREEILSRFFRLIPADSSGLRQIGHIVRWSHYPALQEYQGFENAYHVEALDLEDIRVLRQYIGEEKQFQAFAALAVYPKIEWQIFILVLHEVLGKENLDYDQLLKYCRIPWFRNGDFPKRIRLELLKSLLLDNEINARNALVKYLETIDAPENSLAKSLRDLELIHQKFVLHSSGRNQFKIYANEAQLFLALYAQKKISDIPLRIYLEHADPEFPAGSTSSAEYKKKSTWQSPLVSKGKQSKLSVILERNFSNGIIRKFKRSSSNLLIASTITGIYALLLSFSAVIDSPLTKDIGRDNVVLNDTTSIEIKSNECLKQFSNNDSLKVVIYNPFGDSTSYTMNANFDTTYKLLGRASDTSGVYTFGIFNNLGNNHYNVQNLGSDHYSIELNGNCADSIDVGFQIQYSPRSKALGEEISQTLVNSGYDLMGSNMIDWVGENAIVYHYTSHQDEAIEVKKIIENVYPISFELRYAEQANPEDKTKIQITLSDSIPVASTNTCPDKIGKDPVVYFTGNENTINDRTLEVLNSTSSNLNRNKRLAVKIQYVDYYSGDGLSPINALQRSTDRADLIRKKLINLGIETTRVETTAIDKMSFVDAGCGEPFILKFYNLKPINSSVLIQYNNVEDERISIIADRLRQLGLNVNTRKSEDIDRNVVLHNNFAEQNTKEFALVMSYFHKDWLEIDFIEDSSSAKGPLSDNNYLINLFQEDDPLTETLYNLLIPQFNSQEKYNAKLYELIGLQLSCAPEEKSKGVVFFINSDSQSTNQTTQSPSDNLGQFTLQRGRKHTFSFHGSEITIELLSFDYFGKSKERMAKANIRIKYPG